MKKSVFFVGFGLSLVLIAVCGGAGSDSRFGTGHMNRTCDTRTDESRHEDKERVQNHERGVWPNFQAGPNEYESQNALDREKIINKELQTANTDQVILGT